MSGTDTFTDPRSVANIERMLAALKKKHMTVAEMIVALHMSRSNVVRYVRHLREDPRRIRIYAYQKSDGRPAPIYGPGHAPDAPWPGRASPQLKYARQRAAVSETPEKFESYLARRRADANIQRIRKRPVTWLSALGVAC